MLEEKKQAPEYSPELKRGDGLILTPTVELLKCVILKIPSIVSGNFYIKSTGHSEFLDMN